MTEELEIVGPPITELSKGQRRVLGVLLEKAFTTPEYYPLTLKAVTTGCNQKNNRQPLTNYSEDDVHPVLDELRELGLAAVVHTETGRTERFRHYVRKRFPFNEPQLAIFTELLLRGRQSVGDLRARASRMVPINSLEELREALRGLIEIGAVQASGPLERRGAEVDHNLYLPREGQQLTYDETAGADDDPADKSTRIISDRGASAPAMASATTRPASIPASGASVTSSHAGDAARLAATESALVRLQSENADLRQRVDALQEELNGVADRLNRLERELGA